MIERSFKERAQLLDTTEGTIRRWCQLLEKEGYLINKTDTNRRKLSEQDVEVMSEIKRLVEHIGLTDACSFVAHKYSQSADHDDKSALKTVTEVDSEGRGLLFSCSLCFCRRPILTVANNSCSNIFRSINERKKINA